MKKIILSFLILNLTSSFLGSIVHGENFSFSKIKAVDYARTLDIREGDFIFQHLPGKLLRVIADVTQSQYSHCGIIVRKSDGFYVLEAIGPVIETPLEEWINRGIGHRITIVRLKEKFRKKIPKIIEAAYKFKNLPYDILYQWDDEKIYCSELIYKAAFKGVGIKLADFVELGNLNWQPHEAFIRYMTGGDLPLDRRMITPEDIAKSEKVDTVYSSFPPRESLKDMGYTVADLEGEWSGDYTFPDNQLIQVQLKVNQSGQIQEGQLASNIYIYPSNIKKFNDRTSEFKYILYDNNGTQTVIEGRMDPTKDGVFGQWNDSRGYRGVFSLSKQEAEDSHGENLSQEETSLQSKEYEVISGIRKDNFFA